MSEGEISWVKFQEREDKLRSSKNLMLIGKMFIFNFGEINFY